MLACQAHICQDRICKLCIIAYVRHTYINSCSRRVRSHHNSKSHRYLLDHYRSIIYLTQAPTLYSASWNTLLSSLSSSLPPRSAWFTCRQNNSSKFLTSIGNSAFSRHHQAWMRTASLGWSSFPQWRQNGLLRKTNLSLRRYALSSITNIWTITMIQWC